MNIFLTITGTEASKWYFTSPFRTYSASPSHSGAELSLFLFYCVGSPILRTSLTLQRISHQMCPPTLFFVGIRKVRNLLNFHIVHNYDNDEEPHPLLLNSTLESVSDSSNSNPRFVSINKHPQIMLACLIPYMDLLNKHADPGTSSVPV